MMWWLFVHLLVALVEGYKTVYLCHLDSYSSHVYQVPSVFQCSDGRCSCLPCLDRFPHRSCDVSAYLIICGVCSCADKGLAKGVNFNYKLGEVYLAILTLNSVQNLFISSRRFEQLYYVLCAHGAIHFLFNPPSLAIISHVRNTGRGLWHAD